MTETQTLFLIGGLLALAVFVGLAAFGSNSTRLKKKKTARGPKGFKPRKVVSRKLQPVVQVRPVIGNIGKTFMPKALVVQPAAYCFVHGRPHFECGCKERI